MEIGKLDKAPSFCSSVISWHVNNKLDDIPWEYIYDQQKIQGNGTGTSVIPKGQTSSDSTAAAAAKEPSLFYYSHYRISKFDKSDL